MIPIAQTPESSIYQKDYGEGEILQPGGLEAGIRYGAAAAMEKKRQEAELLKALKPESVQAWDNDMFELNNRLAKITDKYSKDVSSKKISPQQATMFAIREGQQSKDLATMSTEQKKLWEKAKEVYDKDQKGMFDSVQGYQNLDIYKNPDKYMDQIPEIAEQLKIIAGDGEINRETIIKWRAQNGSTWIRPQQRFDSSAFLKKAYGDIKPEAFANNPQALNIPGLKGITTEQGTDYNVPAILATHNTIKQQAGRDFEATKYMQLAQRAVDSAIQVGEDGSITSRNISGDDLLRTVNEYFTIDAENGTINGKPLTPDVLREVLTDAWAIQEGKKFQQTKKSIAARLAGNTKINFPGSGTEDKRKAGYYVTQLESYNQLTNTPEWQQIASTYNTSEKRNSKAYVDEIMGALGKAWNTSEKSPYGYLGYKVNLKTFNQNQNRTESTQDLSYYDNGVWKPIKASGEVGDLQAKRADIAMGYMENGVWKVADEKDIKSGKVLMTDLKPVVILEYQIPTVEQEKEKITKPGVTKTQSGQKDDKPSERDKLIAEINKQTKGKNTVRRVYAADRGVFESLDATFQTADKYRQMREEQGKDTPPIPSSIEITEEELDLFTPED